MTVLCQVLVHLRAGRWNEAHKLVQSDASELAALCSNPCAAVVVVRSHCGCLHATLVKAASSVVDLFPLTRCQTALGFERARQGCLAAIPHVARNHLQ